MINLLKSLSSVLILASMCVFFSCGPKPIQPTPTPLTPSPSIVGTWEHEVPNYHCCLTLNENGTFMFEEFDEPNEAAKFTGKYTYSNGYLKLYDSTDKDLNGEFKVISLTETELVLKDFFEDRENSTFTKKGGTPKISIVGTWEYQDNEYNYMCRLTLSGNENSGTFKFEEEDDEIITGKYTYSNGYLTFSDSNDGDFNGLKIQVVSLTETELVLKDFFEDRENSTFTKKEETPKVSIIGTWKYSWGENEYLQLTFSGSETQGTIKYEEFENGDYDNETGSYTYSNSYLSLPEFESEKIEVVSLTESELVLRDFPDEGNCTFHKQ